MYSKKIFALCGLCFLLSHNAMATSDPSITYKNQRGSTITLVWHAEVANTGTLSGTFTTAVGNCKEDIGVPLPLLGFFNGNAISVTINFPHCKQVVAMTGNLNSNQSNIHTIWLDANQANDPRGEDWNSNIIGSDSYKKIN
jgi:hypothetical protein